MRWWVRWVACFSRYEWLQVGIQFFERRFDVVWLDIPALKTPSHWHRDTIHTLKITRKYQHAFKNTKRYQNIIKYTKKYQNAF